VRAAGSLVRSAWAGLIVVAFASFWRVPVPLAAGLLPLCLEIGETWPSPYLRWIWRAAATLSLGALLLGWRLTPPSPILWSTLALLGLAHFGWLSYREAVSRPRILWLLALGTAVLGVSAFLWRGSGTLPSLYVVLGLMVLMFEHLGEGALWRHRLGAWAPLAIIPFVLAFVAAALIRPAPPPPSPGGPPPCRQQRNPPPPNPPPSRRGPAPGDKRDGLPPP